ncbi:MAG: ABC transporter ATP-binding protein [Bacteroidetes bacterium]|nr:ABC transporter ATP-binding protein [Bacteroidota bacterium]
MPAIIRVQHLSKQFGEINAVDDLSFSVDKGEVYGFLGQNGAGKSTTIRMLLTLIQPTGGTIEILGLDLQKHRNEILRQTGAIIEKPDLYKYLTATENLRLFASMSGVKVSGKRISEQLEMVGLADRANSKVKTFSQGMKQRLGIAIALIHDPQLIVLDEPTNGLDPQGIADVRNLVLHLSKNLGKTLFVSSHLLSEIEQVADSMLIIDKGKKMAEGKVFELFGSSGSIVELKTNDNNEAIHKIMQSSWQNLIDKYDTDKILLKLNKEDIAVFARYLVDADIAIQSLSARHSLEDYFLTLTTSNQHVDAFKN